MTTNSLTSGVPPTPAMADSPVMSRLLSTSEPRKSIIACVHCSRRKVRCDHQNPCSACVKHRVKCEYQQRRQPQQRASRHTLTAEVKALTEKVKRLELLLQEHDIDPKAPPETPGSAQSHSPDQVAPAVEEETQPNAASTVGTEPGGTVSRAQLVHGQGAYTFVNNSLMSSVHEELGDIPNHSKTSSVTAASDDNIRPVPGGLVFGSLSRSSRPSHPPPHLVGQLWSIFKENVDPLTKVVHVPTMTIGIRRAMENPETIPEDMEALVFAVYNTAIMSLSPQDCERLLGKRRATLLEEYASATAAALLRADFMGTTDLAVLQALILHLLSVRDLYEPRIVWSLMGVASRVAQRMGLDQDGTCLGLSTFETEMRRRVWWMLKTLDSQTAERCGLSEFQVCDLAPNRTQLPSNINDNQLDPEDLSPLLLESDTLTDMLFVRVRYKLASLHTTSHTKFLLQGNSSSQWEEYLASEKGRAELESSVNDFERSLKSEVFGFCDPSEPLQLLTMLMGQSAINTIRLLAHHPRRWDSLDSTPPEERQMIWEICISLLKQNNMLQTNPLLKRFAWQAPVVMQWRALIHVLNTLRVSPVTEKAEDVWGLIGSIYSNNPAMINDMQPLHVAVASLCLKAYDARVAAMKHQDVWIQPSPGFISLLRRMLQGTYNHGSQSQAANDNATTRPDPMGSGRLTGTDSDVGNHQGDQTCHSPKPQPQSLDQSDGIIPDGASRNHMEGSYDYQTGHQNHPDNTNNYDTSGQMGDSDALAMYDDSWEDWDRLIGEYDATFPASLASNMPADGLSYNGELPTLTAWDT